MADGWRAAAPHDELTLVPLSDGGPGFLDVLSTATGGELVAVTVSDPLGRAVPAAFLLVDGEDRGVRPFLVPLNDGKTMCAGVTSR